jgi:hypothetical protein
MTQQSDHLLEIAGLQGEVRALTELLSATQRDLAQARRELSELRDDERLGGLAERDRREAEQKRKAVARQWTLPEHAVLRDKIAHRF